MSVKFARSASIALALVGLASCHPMHAIARAPSPKASSDRESGVGRLAPSATTPSATARSGAEVASSDDGTRGAIGPSTTWRFLTSAAFGSLPELEILVVGDSTANCLGWGLRALSSPRVKVELQAKDGCELLTDTCGAETWAAKTRELSPRETLVFVGGAFLYGIPSEGAFEKSCEALWDARFESHLTAHLADLSTVATRVWVVTVPYPLGVYDTADYRKQVDCINASIRKSASRVGGVKILDLAERLCPKGVCEREDHGRVLRPDGVHYAIEALEPTSRWIIGELTNRD